MKNLVYIFLLLILASCNNEGQTELIVSNLIEQKTYYNDGGVESEFFIDENELLQGEYRLYYESGVCQEEGVYRDDELNGDRFDYYENGTLRVRSKFRNDLQIDTTFFYNEQGRPESQDIFNDNSEKIAGVFFHPNGRIKKIRTFLAGQGLITAFKSFDENGTTLLGENQSKYALFEQKSSNQILVEFIGLHYDRMDSVVVSYVQNIQVVNRKERLIRSESFEDVENVLIEFNENDFTKNHLNLIVELYTYIEGFGTPIELFMFQFERGKPIPKDNLYPIYPSDN
ncbi:MAG: hypothetical protein QNK23_14340 [Crocinitomicaceae bacterium]|nr:hypothetical protein [Crocinitomicaceae bacterium]